MTVAGLNYSIITIRKIVCFFEYFCRFFFSLIILLLQDLLPVLLGVYYLVLVPDKTT